MIPVEGGGKPVGAGRFARAAGDEAGFRASPELDGDTLALAAGLVDEMRLGRGRGSRCPRDQPVGDRLRRPHLRHEGQEMCIQLLQLDREIGDFLSVLDTARNRLCGRPDRRPWRQGHPRARAARGSGRRGPRRLALRRPRSARGWPRSLASMGRDCSVTGSATSTSIAPAAADRKSCSPPRSVPIARIRRSRRIHRRSARRDAGADRIAGQVDAEAACPGKLLPGPVGRLRGPPEKGRHANPRHQRYVATHGSAWDYDRRVPVLFWRKGMAAAPKRYRGRHGRHHADAGGLGRLSGRRARSTENASQH